MSNDTPQEAFVKPTVGRIVHFVLPSGAVRPAIVVQFWLNDVGAANLQVFTDGSNDDRDLLDGERSTRPTTDAPGKQADRIVWRTSVPYSAEAKPGHWHWPPRA